MSAFWKGHNYVQAISGGSVISFSGSTYSRNQGGSPAGKIHAEKPSGTVVADEVGDRLGFTDKIVAWDYYGPAGVAYRLYKAAFNRTPDEPGLSANCSLLDQNIITIYDMAAAFLASTEGVSIYGTPADNAAYRFAFVTLLYQHVLGRNPSSGEVSAWSDQRPNYATEQLWRSHTLVGFSESSENHTNVDGIFTNGVTMDPAYF